MWASSWATKLFGVRHKFNNNKDLAFLGCLPVGCTNILRIGSQRDGPLSISPWFPGAFGISCVNIRPRRALRMEKRSFCGSDCRRNISGKSGGVRVTEAGSSLSKPFHRQDILGVTRIATLGCLHLYKTLSHTKNRRIGGLPVVHVTDSTVKTVPQNPAVASRSSLHSQHNRKDTN